MVSFESVCSGYREMRGVLLSPLLADRNEKLVLVLAKRLPLQAARLSLLSGRC